MEKLLDQQQALLQALFAWPAHKASEALLYHVQGVGPCAQRGLAGYQANGHAMAERALGAAYPVVVQLVGADSFAELARALWHHAPPAQGDLAQWGEALIDFVRDSMQLQEVPYLVDVARAEWAMHRCTVAADRPTNLASLALLTTEDPNTLVFQLAPGLAVQHSSWPLASILLAHLQGSPTLAQVSLELQARSAQTVVLWRAGYQVQLRQTLQGEPLFLQALCSGKAIEPALELAANLDFSQWLPQAVHSGLVLGAERQGATGLHDENAMNHTSRSKP